MIHKQIFSTVDPQAFLELLEGAKRVILSTHKQSDGDGLGAACALYHALKQTGCKVRILTVDKISPRYKFLLPQEKNAVQNFDSPHELVEASTDLGIVLDTHEPRMLEPLYTHLKERCQRLVFVDHHPLSPQRLRSLEVGSLVCPQAASVGEVVFGLLQRMQMEITPEIAQALYVSILFDTRFFRYIKDSHISHMIAAELLPLIPQPETVHRNLFSTNNVEKIAFLSKVLGELKFHQEGRIAVSYISLGDLEKHRVSFEESIDVIEIIMGLSSIECVVVFREEGLNKWRVSLRTYNSQLNLQKTAAAIGGGGHLHSAGAEIKGNYQESYEKLIHLLQGQIQELKEDQNEVCLIHKDSVS